jgi:hypothetical protein
MFPGHSREKLMADSVPAFVEESAGTKSLGFRRSASPQILTSLELHIRVAGAKGSRSRGTRVTAR